jgi:hypothetical protein
MYFRIHAFIGVYMDEVKMVEIKFITGETEAYVLRGNSGYWYDKETELFRLETEQGTITIPREVIRTIQFSKKYSGE